jgi:hypothetical protein
LFAAAASQESLLTRAHYGPSFYDICTVTWLNFADTESEEWEQRLREEGLPSSSKDIRQLTIDDAKLDPNDAAEAKEWFHEQRAPQFNPDAIDLQATVENIEGLMTPTQRPVLRRMVQAIETGESYRAAGLHPQKVNRAYDAAHEAFKRAARRVKSEPRVIAEYNPRCVPQELTMQTHLGALMPLIGNGSSHKSKGLRSPQIKPAIPHISELTRPRRRKYIDHMNLGRGVILQERELDCGACVDVEFEGGDRRTILKTFCLPCAEKIAA